MIPAQAEEILLGLAQVFLNSPASVPPRVPRARCDAPNLEASTGPWSSRFRPWSSWSISIAASAKPTSVRRSKTVLGFSQEEWLEDPVRWYQQIHPDDKHRWSAEAAEMFLSGKPLRSAYRVIARDGHVVWFHCEARMVRRADGRPWFIHGVGFDITDLKRTEEALQEERNFVSAILDTVGALVVVLDPAGANRPLQSRLRTNHRILSRSR